MILWVWLVMRVGRAAQVLFLLATRRSLRTPLPWSYFRSLIYTDPRVVCRLVGLLGVLVVWPVGVLVVSEDVAAVLVPIAMAMFLIGAVLPWWISSVPVLWQRLTDSLTRSR